MELDINSNSPGEALGGATQGAGASGSPTPPSSLGREKAQAVPKPPKTAGPSQPPASFKRQTSPEEIPVPDKKSRLGVILAVALAVVVGIGVYWLFGTDSGKQLLGFRESPSSLNTSSVSFDTGATINNPLSDSIANSTPTLQGDTFSSEPTAGSASSPTSNDQKRKQDLASLQSGLESYYADHGTYPVVKRIEDILGSNSVLASALVPTYIAKLPTDPLSDYWYGYKSLDGISYELTARLEDLTDPSGNMETAQDGVGQVYIYRIKGNSSDASQTSASQTSESALSEDEPTSQSDDSLEPSLPSRVNSLSETDLGVGTN